MDKARVLIKTPWQPTIQQTVSVYIGGEVYRVHIAEENGTSTGKCNCRLKSVFGSLEEIESEESDIGTLVSKAEGTPENEDEPRRTSCNPNAGLSIQGNMLIPSGPTIWKDQCKNRGMWAHCPNQKGCRVESMGGNEEEHLACPRKPVEDSPREEEARRIEKKQHDRHLNTTGREQCFHESGSVDFERSHKMSRSQILNDKESRDPQKADGGFTKLLGLTIHTHTEAPQQKLSTHKIIKGEQYAHGKCTHETGGAKSNWTRVVQMISGLP